MPLDLDHLSNADLKALVIALLGEVHELKQQTQALRAEIAQLKGLKGPPSIKPGAKPSGMEAGTDPRPPGTGRSQRRRGKASQRRPPETRILTAGAPAGSRFKGYEDFLVQDVLLQATAVLYRREHWAGRDGQTFLAPLPAGIRIFIALRIRALVGSCAPETDVANRRRRVHDPWVPQRIPGLGRQCDRVSPRSR